MINYQKGMIYMKKVFIVLIAILLVAAIGFGGFIGYQSSKGISYDI